MTDKLTIVESAEFTARKKKYELWRDFCEGGDRIEKTKNTCLSTRMSQQPSTRSGRTWPHTRIMQSRSLPCSILRSGEESRSGINCLRAFLLLSATSIISGPAPICFFGWLILRRLKSGCILSLSIPPWPQMALK